MPQSARTATVTDDLVSRYREDGVVCHHGAFSSREMAIFEEAYQVLMDNPTYKQMELQVVGDGRFATDLTNRSEKAVEQLERVFAETCVADLAQACMGSTDVWFYYEQVWLKEGLARRSPWHQDASYLPVEGPHLTRLWIPLDPVPPNGNLEFIRGSHADNVLYVPSKWDPDDQTEALYTAESMQPLPNIEGHREDWDIVSFDTGPGDVIMFHTGILHGGAATAAGQRRRSLSLMFYGDDAQYAVRPVPEKDASMISEGLPTTPAEVVGMHPGEPFRLSYFPQLR
jgi:ectoine hydroxylase-related dioxygenase (phytanoyl-CoA dioxygenase family)